MECHFLCSVGSTTDRGGGLQPAAGDGAHSTGHLPGHPLYRHGYRHLPHHKIVRSFVVMAVHLIDFLIYIYSFHHACNLFLHEEK